MKRSMSTVATKGLEVRSRGESSDTAPPFSEKSYRRLGVYVCEG